MPGDKGLAAGTTEEAAASGGDNTDNDHGFFDAEHRWRTSMLARLRAGPALAGPALSE